MPTLWGHSDDTLTHNIVTTTSTTTTSPPMPEDETGTTAEPDPEKTVEKEAA